ncbi:MAG: ABC transporter substrate-binding protein [Euryarchaeota archaeon]|nr:ABC transporter substrate-binding protein [Euryarchaeota archaeon]
MRTNTILAGIATTLLLLTLSIPAAASDYTLDVFGNANEDDTINMQDVTYTELIILEYRDETELTDAKHDGKINMQDVTQIELIILGKEKEITIKDSADRTVTVNKPVERIVVLTYPDAEAIKIVKAEEMVVGVSSDIKARGTFFPELSKLPSAGVTSNPDFERILELNPDIIFTGKLRSMGTNLENKLPDTIAVTCWDMGRLEVMTKNIRMLGYILGNTEDAREFCTFYQEYLDEMIHDRVSEIPDGDRERVYIEYSEDYIAFAAGSSGHEICVAAGGVNIAADLPRFSEKPLVKVDCEWLIVENPDVVVATVRCKTGLCGYGEDDPGAIGREREQIMSRSGWGGMNAVAENRTYLIDMDLVGSTANFIGATYMAKWLYPDLFEDLDPEAFHQEYLTRFQRLDYDLDEHGVFVCPSAPEVA